MLLTNLRVGQKGTITFLLDRCPLYTRLLDLGFSSGTEIKCLMESPLGNPKAYLIKGSVIAIRNEDANYIHIRSE